MPKKLVLLRDFLAALFTHSAIFAMCCIVSFSTYAQSQTHINGDDFKGQQTISVTEPMAEPYVANKKVKSKLAHIVFYRPQNGYMPGVVSLEVNSHYHGALQLGAYSELCLPAGAVPVAAHMMQVGVEPRAFYDATTTISTQEGQSAYLRVIDFGDGRARISQVQPDVAINELKDTRRQVHVRTRVPGGVDCVEPAPEVTSQKEALVLVADGLFNFGRSEINTSNNSARQSIDELIRHIQKTYGAKQDLTNRQQPLRCALPNFAN